VQTNTVDNERERDLSVLVLRAECNQSFISRRSKWLAFFSLCFFRGFERSFSARQRLTFVLRVRITWLPLQYWTTVL